MVSAWPDCRRCKERKEAKKRKKAFDFNSRYAAKMTPRSRCQLERKEMVMKLEDDHRSPYVCVTSVFICVPPNQMSPIEQLFTRV